MVSLGSGGGWILATPALGHWGSQGSNPALDFPSEHSRPSPPHPLSAAASRPAASKVLSLPQFLPASRFLFLSSAACLPWAARTPAAHKELSQTRLFVPSWLGLVLLYCFRVPRLTQSLRPNCPRRPSGFQSGSLDCHSGFAPIWNTFQIQPGNCCLSKCVLNAGQVNESK